MPWKLTSNHGWKFSYLHFITIYKYIFLLVCFKKKKNVHHALLQEAWHFIQEDFSPPSSLGGSLREGMRTLRMNRGVETGPTNSIISSLGVSGGSSEPAYHARSCPSPADLLTAFLGLEGKPLRAPRVCWIVISEGRCYPFPSSRRLFGVTLRAT